MAVEKFSISFDPELLAMVREAADDDDETVSAWMAEAARQRIRHLALGHAVDALLEDLGITEQEALAAAAEARKHAIHTTGSATKASASRTKQQSRTKPRAQKTATAKRGARAAGASSRKTG